MSYISDQLLAHIKQNSPDGRAYNYPVGGEIEGLQIALIEGGSEPTYDNARSILDGILPGANFTDGTADSLDNDCNFWEGVLGLIQYGVTSASTPTRLQRMAAISTKWKYPGSDICRQSAGYLQNMLQAAGFNVFVYENLSNQSPDDILGSVSGAANLGGFDLGTTDLGEGWDVTVIANYLDEARDSEFVINDGSYQGTFFIAGSTLTTFATVPLVRKAAFRQMILQLKPAHLVGYLFLNYT